MNYANKEIREYTEAEIIVMAHYIVKHPDTGNNNTCKFDGVVYTNNICAVYASSVPSQYWTMNVPKSSTCFVLLTPSA